MKKKLAQRRTSCCPEDVAINKIQGRKDGTAAHGGWRAGEAFIWVMSHTVPPVSCRVRGIEYSSSPLQNAAKYL